MKFIDLNDMSVLSGCEMTGTPNLMPVDGAIRVLRRVRWQLKPFGSICQHLRRDMTDLQILRWIRRQLAGAERYEYWLRREHPQRYRRLTPRDAYEARLAWIDAMIRELEGL